MTIRAGQFDFLHFFAVEKVDDLLGTLEADSDERLGRSSAGGFGVDLEPSLRHFRQTEDVGFDRSAPMLRQETLLQQISERDIFEWKRAPNFVVRQPDVSVAKTTDVDATIPHSSVVVVVAKTVADVVAKYFPDRPAARIGSPADLVQDPAAREGMVFALVEVAIAEARFLTLDHSPDFVLA